MIDVSYGLVIAKLKKGDRQGLELMYRKWVTRWWRGSRNEVVIAALSTLKKDLFNGVSATITN